MEIVLKRMARKEAYTIGRLYVDGMLVCNTLEDRDRLFFGQDKVMHETAIPCGRYSVSLNSYSPKFGNRSFYKETCGGCLPLINNVPGFTGIRIHCGNTVDDTSGCILVGINDKVGRVSNSQATFKTLMDKYLTPARQRREPVYITIQ